MESTVLPIVSSSRLARAAALSLALLVTGCGGDDAATSIDAGTGVDAGPRQVVSDTRTLGVGEIAEAVLVGGPPDRARIRLTAPVAELDWNIHGHANGSTQTVKEELGIMSTSYTFEPTAQAEWFLLLRNKATAPMTVTVTIDLYGDMAWSGWQ